MQINSNLGVEWGKMEDNIRWIAGGQVFSMNLEQVGKTMEYYHNGFPWLNSIWS